ncbi:PREDICTED: uncharacterized protein LOC109206725 [Nicotiana attenuata]|uniref:C2H2-type domain-containing protein n=1 Tax=Nicotiana attenuata TaxID=49451 RepID=A0A1J6IM12_NICAT|nr:PREDICTED: uncharacterized protein LOC109206725 [Nicotiana attenuata]OIT05886.1 hypothetical protein A4A49_13318 [Nicotiana attenuata]
MAKSKRNPSIKHSKQSSKSRSSSHGQKEEKPHSWAVVRSLFTCKHLQARPEQQIILKEEKIPKCEERGDNNNNNNNNKKCKKMKCSGSICSNTKVMHRPEPSPSPPKGRSCKNDGSTKVTLNNSFSSASSSSFSLHSTSAPSTSPATSSLRGMPFRKLSGCYECRMVVDPIARDPSLRSTICSECGDIFMKLENLELHQAVRHAVSELGPEDTSRNIVEIIFQSSWLNKKTPVCKIDRILKIRNTPRTISRFEEYRDGIKTKATNLPKKHPRCIADGNELLRFHCTTFMCSLGLNGSSNLCTVPNCNVCTIIKNGFKLATIDGTKKGILTTATSGKAHDSTRVVSHDDDDDDNDNDKRAMLVCRVIAGRVKKNLDGNLEEYDSIAGAAGVYSNLDELYVFNPKAILPCFVVIYKGF